MSKSNTTENDFVKMVFLGDDPAWRAAGATLYLSLHTADPGEGGTQTSSECTYTPYARVGVSKDASGWTVSGAQAVNTADVIWPECTSGAETITHVGIGTATTTPTGPVFAQGTGPLNKDRTCVCRGTGHRLTKQGTAAPCNHCNP